MSGTNNVVVLPYNSPSYSPSYLNNNDQNSRDLQDLKDQEKQEQKVAIRVSLLKNNAKNLKEIAMKVLIQDMNEANISPPSTSLNKIQFNYEYVLSLELFVGKLLHEIKNEYSHDHDENIFDIVYHPYDHSIDEDLLNPEIVSLYQQYHDILQIFPSIAHDGWNPMMKFKTFISQVKKYPNMDHLIEILYPNLFKSTLLNLAHKPLGILQGIRRLKKNNFKSVSTIIKNLLITYLRERSLNDTNYNKKKFIRTIMPELGKSLGFIPNYVPHQYYDWAESQIYFKNAHDIFINIYQKTPMIDSYGRVLTMTELEEIILSSNCFLWLIFLLLL